MPDTIVECYSGYTYAQEPRAVIWQGHRQQVTLVGRRWRAPEGPAFWVQTETGAHFELQYHEHEDRWTATACSAAWFADELPAGTEAAGSDHRGVPTRGKIEPDFDRREDKEVQR